MQKLAFALKCRIEDLMGLETFDTGEELMSRIKEIDESSGGDSLTVIHTTDPLSLIHISPLFLFAPALDLSFIHLGNYLNNRQVSSRSFLKGPLY